MTDIQITTRHASRAVMEFLATATAPQRDWYLVQGEPQCISGSYATDTGIETHLHAALRGVRLAGPVATPEEAIAKAAAFKAELLANPLEPVDEVRAGIDGEAVDIAARFEQTGARMEAIVHIGSMLDGSTPLADALGDIVVEILDGREQARPSAPLLADVDPRAAERPVHLPEVVEDLPILATLADMGRLDDSARLDEFGALAHDAGTFGFLVQISVPTYVPHKDGRGASIRTGDRFVCWRYASTYAIAAERALDWAEAEITRMWPQRKAA